MMRPAVKDFRNSCLAIVPGAEEARIASERAVEPGALSAEYQRAVELAQRDAMERSAQENPGDLEIAQRIDQEEKAAAARAAAELAAADAAAVALAAADRDSELIEEDERLARSLAEKIEEEDAQLAKALAEKYEAEQAERSRQEQEDFAMAQRLFEQEDKEGQVDKPSKSTRNSQGDPAPAAKEEKRAREKQADKPSKEKAKSPAAPSRLADAGKEAVKEPKPEATKKADRPSKHKRKLPAAPSDPPDKLARNV